MKSSEIRWVQRFNNFKKAFNNLHEAVELFHSRPLRNLERLGVIQIFKYTHDLAWKVLKDYIEHTGGQTLIGSKDSTREAYQKGLIQNGEIWMAMIASRNLTSHTYNESTADDVLDKVIRLYYDEFKNFEFKMESLIP